MENKTDKYTLFSKANEELMQLKKDDIFEMPKIEWWLLKYSDLYKAHVKKNDPWYGASIFAKEHNPFNRFWQYWECLDEISKIYRLESYMKEQMKEYEAVKDDLYKLKDLMQRNELLCLNELLLFNTNYMDDEKEADHVSIRLRFDEVLLINYQNFENINTFNQIFQKLFWEDHILPESIERIDEEMKKTHISTESYYESK
jgi:hypothetical protein